MGNVPWRSQAPNPSHISVGKSTVQFDAAGNVVQEWRRQYPTLELMQEVVDYALLIEVADMGEYEAFLKQSLATIPSIMDFWTNFI